MRYLFFIFSIFSFFLVWAQPATTTIESGLNNHSYWQIAPRIGYDILPLYEEDYTYIDYDGGLEMGISINKYWNNWGIQLDFDYLTNQPVLDKIASPVWVNFPFNPTQYNLLVRKEKVSRWAAMIGPAYKWERTRFSWENALLGGIGMVQKGEFLASADTDPTSTFNDQLITYQSGFRNEMVFSMKFQTRFNYFFTPNFGLHIGAYYLRHFNVFESRENTLLDNYYQGAYQNLYYAENQQSTYTIQTSSGTMNVNAFDGSLSVRGDNDNSSCCALEVASIGLFAGVTFKIPSQTNKMCEGCIYCEVCGKNHLPPLCCNDCPIGCDVSIIAKDKFTGKVLNYTDVVLKNNAGQALQTGTTNSFGLVTFNKVPPGDYSVEGKLYDIDLEGNVISTAEFDQCKAQGGGVIEKEIIYGDENFILQGNVIVCNSNQPVDNANISLKDKFAPSIKNTFSDAQGKFRFHLKQASTYIINGEKNGYYSKNPLEISTHEFDRNKTLEIEFEMCVDPCGQSVRLENIEFDVDKSNILPAAEPDLYKVLQIMQLNPNVRVKMTSHTDSRASDDYNLALSQRRANSTVEWLVAHGADRSRLTAIGMGETQLLNKNCPNGATCTDDEHRINRRTEFIVECVNNY